MTPPVELQISLAERKVRLISGYRLVGEFSPNSPDGSPGSSWSGWLTNEAIADISVALDFRKLKELDQVKGGPS